MSGGSRKLHGRMGTLLLGVGVLVGAVVTTSSAFAQPKKAVVQAHSGRAVINLRYLPEKSRMNAPVPIFITVDSWQPPKSVELHYKPFGSNRFIKLPLEPLEALDASVSPSHIEGFAVMIPCDDVTTTGPVKLFIVARDEDGAEMAHAGTERSPIEIAIRAKLDVDPPSFPGHEPPKQCADASQCYFPELEYLNAPKQEAAPPPPVSEAGCASCTVPQPTDRAPAALPALSLLAFAALRRRARHSLRRLGVFAVIASLLIACDRPSDSGATSASASAARPTVPPVEVQTFGELHKVMHEGQTSGVYTIRDALAKPHAFAVGALSELRGEVTIRDGVAWLGYPDGQDARVVQEVSEREEATLFVVSHVEHWQTLPIAATVPLAELDAYIEKHAAAAGIDISKPFPVRIEGPMVSVDWHVIDGTRLTPGGSHEDHKRAAVTGKLSNVDAHLIGFFAQNAQGVFTHMDQRSHFHVIEPRGRVTGHVDDAVVGAGATLMVPANR